MAVRVLHVLSPGRYPQDIDKAVSLAAKNHAVFETKNDWRRSKGLLPLEAVKSAPIEPVAYEQFDTLVKQLVNGDEASRKQASLKLEGFGLSALPRINRFLKDDPAPSFLCPIPGDFLVRFVEIAGAIVR